MASQSQKASLDIKVTSANKKNTTSPEAAGPSAAVDAGRTFSRTMGPVQTSWLSKPQEIVSWPVVGREKVSSYALVWDKDIPPEWPEDVVRNEALEGIHDLEYWMTHGKQVIGELQAAASANMQDGLQLQAEINNRDAYIEQLTDAFKHEQEKHQETRGKAQLADYNYADSIQKLKAERNELRSQLSKVASDMLTAGGNPDIADRSDPNRAMQLSERFSAIYDDDWTDAYETLTQRYKKDTKEAIQFLLSLLQECLEFCKQTSESQMDALRNVIMHPFQPASQDVKAGKEKARIDSSDVKALMDLRRRVSTNSAYEVKVQCMSQMKRQRKRPGDADLIGAASAYCEKCIDICWLMVLHDPPLHVALDVKLNAKMDPAHYSSYGGTGELIDYLVWPPLYNGVGGGLLAKGTASPISSKRKPKDTARSNPFNDIYKKPSKCMSDQLMTRIPNITDLSDSNRPEKIGERYQECYDNQWTDAYEVVEKSYPADDGKAVRILLAILTEAKKFCDREADRHMKDLEKALLQSSGMAKYLRELEHSVSSKARVAVMVKDFVQECVTVCWLMALQDPPVVFGPRPGHMEHFDTSVYKAYTQSGSKINYVVWPPLYLHEGGPLVAKGIAQAYKSPSDRRVSSSKKRDAGRSAGGITHTSYTSSLLSDMKPHTGTTATSNSYPTDHFSTNPTTVPSENPSTSYSSYLPSQYSVYPSSTSSSYTTTVQAQSRGTLGITPTSQSDRFSTRTYSPTPWGQTEREKFHDLYGYDPMTRQSDM